jgi:hypothetical protein
VVVPVFLFIASLLTLIAIARSLRWSGAPHNGWRVFVLLVLALLAFGVGTCSALIVIPGSAVLGNGRWPAWTAIATLAVLAFLACMGRPGKPAHRAALSYMLVASAIILVIAAAAMLLDAEH